MMAFFQRLALLLLLGLPAVAQNLLGVATSPYGGTHSLYANPAFAADSPHRYYLNLVAINGHVDNNYVRYQAPFSLLQLATGRVPTPYRRASGSVSFQPGYTGEILDGKPKSGTAWTDVRGPSALFRIGNFGAVAITTRMRAAAQLNNASEQLLSVIRAGLETEQFLNIPNQDNQFSAHSTTYAELGLTLAGTILENDYQRLSLGVTVKRLQGLTSGFLINRGLTYRLLSDQTAPNGVVLQVDALNADLGYTTYLQTKGRSVTVRQLFDRDNPGKGWGTDIGLSYQVLDEETPDTYRLRLGVALTDLGSIRYSGNQYVQRYRIQEAGRRFTSADFNEVNSSEDIAGVLRDKLNVTPASNLGRYTSGLPASLSLQADLKVWDKVYLAGSYLQDLRPKDAISLRQPTLLAVTPHVETPKLGVALPLSYLNRTFMVGASLRFGPVFVGSDNLIGLIGSNVNQLQPRGADIYAGLAIPSLRKRP